jgi:phospholipid/cholesterol/gamma-HCH transport system substrate-binding protein
MRGLAGPLIKSAIFIVITGLATALLAVTIVNGSGGGGHSYSAIFTDATMLNSGDDIRMAGVRIGQVESVSITDKKLAKVTFSVSNDVPLARTLTAAIHYRNLIGQRYIALDQGTGSLDDPLPPGSQLGTDRTEPALDLTVLFNGFQPLFQALDPKQVNLLAGEIIAVFQGEGPTIDDLLNQAASLTSTLADKDKVIGEVIDNLNSVLKTVNKHGTQLSTLLSSLAQLVSGLAADRTSIGSAISGISGLTSDVADLFAKGQTPVKDSIAALGDLSANLAASSGTLNSFLQGLPTKLSRIGRLASYGSWVNFYLCSVSGDIPVPGKVTEIDGSKQPSYTGGVGVANPAARCSG